MSVKSSGTLGWVACCALLAAMALAGCSSTDVSAMVTPYRAGDFAAAAEAAKGFDGDDDEDGIWILMNKGKILMDAGQWKESLAAYQECTTQLEALAKEMGEEGASASGSGGAAANTYGDDRAMTYTGTIYDTIMLEAYAGLAAAALKPGDVAAHRRRMHDRQQEALQQQDDRAAARETARAEAVKEVNGKLTGEYKDKKGKKRKQAELVGEFETEATGRGCVSAFSGPRTRAATMIPAAVYYSGVAAYCSGNQQALSMSASELCSLDCTKSDVDSALGTELSGPRTFIIFENGLGAWKSETFIGGTHFTNVKGVPFAQLNTDLTLNRADGLKVNGANTRPLCDMNAIRALEYRELLPVATARAMRSWVTKQITKAVGAGLAAGSDNRDTQMAGLAIFLAGAISEAAAGADLRCWETLPAEMQGLAIATPADGNLNLQLDGDGAAIQRKVAPGQNNIVFVRSLRKGHIVATALPCGAAGVVTQ